MKAKALGTMVVVLWCAIRSISAAILPSDATVDGKTIPEWTAEWWKWAFYAPTNQHPLFDPDGAWANGHQPEAPIFFVAGVLQFSNVANRSFTVPEGKYLLVPVINVWADDVGSAVPLPVPELRKVNERQLLTATNLHAGIDGAPVSFLKDPDTGFYDHRAISPVFNVLYTDANNIHTFLVGEPVEGLIDPIVADGHWLLIEPLAPGTHVLNFGGTLGVPAFDLEITNTITVVEVPLTEWLSEFKKVIQQTTLPKGRQRSMIAKLTRAEKWSARNQRRSALATLNALAREIDRRVLSSTLHDELTRRLERTIARAQREESVIGGRTVAEWSAEWWKWVFSASTNANPQLDMTGEFANTSQPDGGVFFLGGHSGLVDETIHRTFTAPENKFLFLSILTAQIDNIDTDPPLPVDELRRLLVDFLNNPWDLHMSIDGTNVPNLLQHRALSPVFDFTFTDADNFKAFNAGHPILGLVDPMLADGYWLMLEPLPPGTHVLNYGGAFRYFIFFTNDVVAHITVHEVPPTQWLKDFRPSVERSGLTKRAETALSGRLDRVEKEFDAGDIAGGIAQLRAFQKAVRTYVAPNTPGLADYLVRFADRIVARAERDL